MLFKEFSLQLKNHSDKQLRFLLPDGEVIDQDFHLTEIKKSNHETIDCGSKRHQWNETIIQVWQPEERIQRTMSVSKAVKIIETSDNHLSLLEDSAVVFEWGRSVRQNLYPKSLRAEGDQLLVELAGLETACKARHRYDVAEISKLEDSKRKACCA